MTAIDDIRARLAAATHGEWSREMYEDGEDSEGPYGVHPGCPGPMVESRRIVVYGQDGSIVHVADVHHDGDAALLVKAPEDMRRLLAVVDALPRCSICKSVALWTAWDHVLYCEEHHRIGLAGKGKFRGIEAIPYADALRALMKAGA